MPPPRLPHTDAMSNKDVAYHMAFHFARKRSLKVPRSEVEREKMTRRHLMIHHGDSRRHEAAGHVHGGTDLNPQQFS